MDLRDSAAVVALVEVTVTGPISAKAIRRRFEVRYPTEAAALALYAEARKSLRSNNVAVVIAMPIWKIADRCYISSEANLLRYYRRL